MNASSTRKIWENMGARLLCHHTRRNMVDKMSVQSYLFAFILITRDFNFKIKAYRYSRFPFFSFLFFSFLFFSFLFFSFPRVGLKSNVFVGCAQVRHLGAQLCADIQFITSGCHFKGLRSKCLQSHARLNNNLPVRRHHSFDFLSECCLITIHEG